MFFVKVLSLFKALPFTPPEASVASGHTGESGLLSPPRNAEGLRILSDDFDLPMRKDVASLESIECDDRERGGYGRRLSFFI